MRRRKREKSDDYDCCNEAMFSEKMMVARGVTALLRGEWNEVSVGEGG